jgi:hypothetical protein
MKQFDRSQQQAALVVMESMAWGDMDSAIRDLEICLRRALEATGEDFVSAHDLKRQASTSSISPVA